MLLRVVIMLLLIPSWHTRTSRALAVSGASLCILWQILVPLLLYARPLSLPLLAMPDFLLSIEFLPGSPTLRKWWSLGKRQVLLHTAMIVTTEGLGHPRSQAA